jgi:tetratricopeptide (TPR) repeat protein
LIAFYVFSPPKSFWDFQVLCGLLCFVFLVAVAFLVRRTQPLISFAILWFLAFLALALNVRWLAAAAFAERYLFLPSLGFAWIVAFYFVKLWRCSSPGRLLRKRLVTAAISLVVALCFIRIYVRNRDWHDNEVLYKQTLQLEPNAIYIRINLGDVYWSSGRPDQAIDEWERAHQEAPKLIPPLPLTNLGMAAVLSRNWDKAEAYLQQALQLSPKESVALLWLARMREAQGRTAEAEEMLLRAQEFAPYDTRSYAELGELYFKQNQLAAAAREFHVAAQQMNDPLYWDRLGSIYLQLGQLQDAEDAYHAALQANPYFSESDVGLGQVYERRGDKVAAREHYTRGLKDNPNNPIALAGLARLQDVR